MHVVAPLNLIPLNHITRLHNCIYFIFYNAAVEQQDNVGAIYSISISRFLPPFLVLTHTDNMQLIWCLFFCFFLFRSRENPECSRKRAVAHVPKVSAVLLALSAKLGK